MNRLIPNTNPFLHHKISKVHQNEIYYTNKCKFSASGDVHVTCMAECNPVRIFECGICVLLDEVVTTSLFHTYRIWV